jgi:hypothetical protein
MRITYQGTRIQLQGVVDDHSTCPAVSLAKLKGLLKHGSVLHAIQSWLPDHSVSNEDLLSWILLISLRYLMLCSP